MIADQVQARQWRQGGQAADELARLKHQAGGAVGNHITMHPMPV